MGGGTDSFRLRNMYDVVLEMLRAASAPPGAFHDCDADYLLAALLAWCR